MSLTAPTSDSTALTELSVLTAAQVDTLPWTPVPGCRGVDQKVLWSMGGFTQALIRYAPGSATPGIPHLAAHHHVWVHSGEITLAGARLTTGSYVHVPPGVAHAANEVGAEGCTLVQMHRPHPPREAELLLAGA
jgi:hypothetical protein